MTTRCALRSDRPKHSACLWPLATWGNTVAVSVFCVKWRALTRRPTVTRSIFCDESGYTGPNLLDEQRFYVNASVAMAHDLVGRVVNRYGTTGERTTSG